ncbi:putative leucine-rich repeat domain, L domain-containing protein [Rosa chinensis]|uniref:Putative leucine-rich repeat domain, L domain-containing protein n=1 Tax=Rosa chinensis TaxID=74649 RepID=A0A2P6QCZ2_ROSCH|nr:putative leucine-rich repeat domain, L domain-containing protein [Rosa chinensis]
MFHSLLSPPAHPVWKCNGRIATTMTSFREHTQRYLELNSDKDDLPWLQLFDRYTIPNEIGHLPCLEEFVLGGNNLSGLIPTSIFHMSAISIISLDSNQFSDSREKFQQAGLSKTSLVNHFFLTICGASLFQVSACRRKTGISIFKYVIPGILSSLLLVTSILIL